MYHIILWLIIGIAPVFRARALENMKDVKLKCWKVFSSLLCASTVLLLAALLIQHIKPGEGYSHPKLLLSYETWQIMWDGLCYIGEPFRNLPDTLYSLVFLGALLGVFLRIRDILGIKTKKEKEYLKDLPEGFDFDSFLHDYEKIYDESGPHRVSDDIPKERNNLDVLSAFLDGEVEARKKDRIRAIIDPIANLTLMWLWIIIEIMLL